MKLRILMTGLAMTIAAGAQASVTVIASQAAFNAAGTSVQNTNFDTNGPGFTLPGSPYTIGALTFVAGQENAIGGITLYNLTRSLLTDNYRLGTTVLIAGTHDLFAFNAGNFSTTSVGTTTVDIVTNLGSYQFTPTTLTYVSGGSLTFLGYQTGPGEYFTSVKFSGEFYTGATDVQIGDAGATVPEPASWMLMIAGFALVGSTMRRRAAVVA